MQDFNDLLAAYSKNAEYPIEQRYFTRIRHFGQQFCGNDAYGIGHGLFVLFASFPVLLTPDLLHKLRFNFKNFVFDGKNQFIQPVAVSDLLLSGLCREINRGAYEMPSPIRFFFLQLLKDLASNPSLISGLELPDSLVSRIAAFTGYYASQPQNRAHTPHERATQKANLLFADMYLNPSMALNQIAQDLADAQIDTAFQRQLTLVTEQILNDAKLAKPDNKSESLDYFPDDRLQLLLTYSQALKKLYIENNADEFDALVEKYKIIPGEKVSPILLPVPYSNGRFSTLSEKLPQKDYARLLIAENIAKHERGEDASILDQANCGLTDLEEQIPEVLLMSWLKGLDLSFNQVKDGRFLEKLIGITSLDLSGNQISDVIFLTNLTNLTSLSLSDNQISDVSILKNLTNLTSLNLSGNKINDVSILKNLTNLTSLNLSGNKISDASILKNLTNLASLNLNGNKISDVSFLKNLTNLADLSLGNNQINEITSLSALPNLKKLILANNTFHDLSPLLSLIQKGIAVSWARYGHENAIYLYNNPLIAPPVEIAQAGRKAILEYFDQMRKGLTSLNEIKVIFLGEGAAGKTSLIKRVRTEAFDPNENQTHGIRIQPTPFVVDGDTVQAHLWDFGGQEVMHATHQFFLSRRCVYVLVLNSRSDEKAEYWLKLASSFGGNSPVLVVLNKMDENPNYDVERKHLREKYPQIVDFIKVSCQTGAGIAEFKAALLRQIAASDTRHIPFPTEWAAVKAYLANIDADYINMAEYKDVCEAEGVTQSVSQSVLLDVLNDLGVVINFKDLRHFDTIVLNPLWLTNGMYRIFNSPIVAQQLGILREDQMGGIINAPHERGFYYPADKLNYIAGVMEAFELCFHVDADTYVVPQLLSNEEPDFEMEGSALHFVLHFPEFLPDSIFPRLMVKLHPYISGSLRWRTGMVLHKPSIFDAQARIRVDKEDRKIKIDLCGANPRRLLSFIRETIREIMDSFVHLKYEELVPVPGTQEVMEYNYLLEAEKAGEESVFVRGKGNVSVKDLLYGVEEAAMREDAAQMPLKVFLSYAPQDDPHRQALRTALAPLMRLHKLQVWDDRDIAAGHEWQEQISRELAAADIVLCLISADFIASDFCYSQELAQALEAHYRNEKIVIPVRTRPCAWDNLPIAQIQGVPTSSWLATAPNADEALTEVVERIHRFILRKKSKKIFISYADADEAAMQNLDKFLGPLERSGDISILTDRKILPGQRWKDEILRNLESADMILLLVSANFLVSDFIYDEKILLTLRRMKEKGKPIIPIILNYCLWDYSPLASIQALPRGAEPIAGFINPAHAWNEVARGVMARLRDLASISTPAKNVQTEPSKEIMYIDKPIDLVARADLRGALRLLAEHSPSEEVTQQQQRLSNLERNERMGTWSHDQASRERNKIALAILKLNDTETSSAHPSPLVAPATGGTNITDSKNVVLGSITSSNVYIGDANNLGSDAPKAGETTAANLTPSEKEGIERAIELKTKIINKLRETLALEDDPIRSIRYEEQLRAAETVLADLKAKLG